MDEWESFTAWITHLALSKGIFKAQARKRLAHGVDMIIVGNDERPAWGAFSSAYYHREGRNWHRTEAAAIERAEVMRVAKIASLEKQIAKLRALRFVPQESGE